MADKVQDIFSSSFSGEHAYFGDILRSAREKMDAIDYELSSLPASRQPTLNMTDGRDNNFATDRRRDLLTERSEIVRNTKSFVTQATKHNNIETQKELSEKADFLLDDKNLRTKAEKSMDEMSDKFASTLKNEKDANNFKNPKVPQHVDKASDRFNNRLNYARENSSDEVMRFKDISQPTSSRERFNNNLSYKLESVEFKKVEGKTDAPGPKISAREQFNKNLQYPEVEAETKEISEPSLEDVDISDTLEEPQSPESSIEDKDIDED